MPQQKEEEEEEQEHNNNNAENGAASLPFGEGRRREEGWGEWRQ